ncbi:CYFA0S10e00914g1_1 [Cyberlindnera fabianii]|nr:CYFA0S10e00914g1_1 [Cyberlindnera fabianii]
MFVEELTFISPHAHEASTRDPLRVAKDVFAGVMGGVAQVLVGQPFDTAKVRLQSDAVGRYNGMLDVSRSLIKEEGALAFYKGTMAPLVGVGICTSIQFAVNEYMKRIVFGTSHTERLKPWQYYIAGTAAGFANAVVASPVEHIRSRLQMQITGNTSAIAMLRAVYQKAGLAHGVMRGYLPTLMRGLGTGIYFMSFEQFVQFDISHNNILREDIPGWKMCLYGGIAGNCMWAASYPIDFIKTKLQTDSLDTPKYRGIKDVISAVYNARGIRGFFKGFVPTMLRAAPANAATFYAFELAIRAMG